MDQLLRFALNTLSRTKSGILKVNKINPAIVTTEPEKRKAGPQSFGDNRYFGANASQADEEKR